MVKPGPRIGLIYFVPHLQGCPVTIILVAKFIEPCIIRLNSKNFSNDVEVDFSLKPKEKNCLHLRNGGSK